MMSIMLAQEPCVLGEVYVSEAANAGVPEDYIEIFNNGVNACSLAGFQLDDSEELEDFTFGNVTLNPGTYWVGYSNEDNSFSSGLNNGGDMVVLADAAGDMLITTLQQSMQSENQIELSQSFGDNGIGCYTFPTPGDQNSGCIEFSYGCTDPDANNYNENADLDDGSCEYSTASCLLGEVYVSEAANIGDPEDYIEIHNAGDNECTLYGFKLDDSELLDDFTFGNIILASGEFWVGFEDDDNSFSSGLSADGDIVVFADSNGNSTITTILSSMQSTSGIELSQSFEINGNGCYTLPTPGQANVECIDGELATLDDSFSNKFMLKSAYPNPFNPFTNVVFHVPTPSAINIAIYDIHGRQVKNLMNEFKLPGIYNVDWNAEHYSSGTYFVKIISNSYKKGVLGDQVL